MHVRECICVCNDETYHHESRKTVIGQLGTGQRREQKKYNRKRHRQQKGRAERGGSGNNTEETA